MGMVKLRRYKTNNIISAAGLDPKQFSQVSNDGEYMKIQNKRTGNCREIYIGINIPKQQERKDPSQMLIEKLGRTMR